MNIETLLSTIMNNMGTTPKAEQSLPASLSLSDYLPQGIELKAGQVVVLNIDSSGQMLLATNDGRQTVLPSALLQVGKNVQINAPAVLEAKVSNSQNNNIQLQINTINNQTPQQYLRATNQTGGTANISEAIIKDISGGGNIPLSSVNLREAVASYVTKLPLPPQQKNELLSVLQQVEVKVQVNTLQTNEGNAGPAVFSGGENIQASLQKTVAETALQLTPQLGDKSPLAQSAATQNIASAVADKLQPLVGQTFAAEVIPGNQTITFKTPLGNIQPDIPIQLPESVIPEMEIAAILVQDFNHQTQPLTVADKIQKALQHIKAQNPQLYPKIAAHLPADNTQMLSNMSSFVKAAAKGDIRQWLGTEVVNQLESQGAQGREILSDFQNILQSSNKQTPAWRIVEIPYYAENRIETIRLAIKQYPDDEDNTEDPRQKFGTRFVVDTNFTRLGAFQFDGFSIAKEHRFDLIIRTERSVGNDLCANIMQLFKTTLNDVGYVGNIKINLKENFIKISENNTEDKFLSQDLFI